MLRRFITMLAAYMLACLVTWSVPADAARILAILSFPSSSHQVVYRPFVKELARRGHQLVVITPDPAGDAHSPNYTEVDISSTYRFFRRTDFASARQSRESQFDQFAGFYDVGDHVCETVMAHEQVRRMVDANNTREHYDLVIVEWIVTPCMAAFAHRFHAPLIGIASLTPMSVMNDAIGNPSNPSYIPEIALPYTDKHRTFLQRLHALVYSLRFTHFYYTNLLPRQDAIVKKHFGPSTPHILELNNQVSMLLMNSLRGFHPPQPNVPAVVHFNGFHIITPKRLPEDIQQFLDGARKGAIYFSLGSNVRSDQLSAEKRGIFLEVFSEMPDYHVLWKWESDRLPGQPSNVKIGKWMPQQDVLRHPKVRVFITQGGLQSTEEAIQMKVPMIGIPFLGDQDYNTKLAEERGVSIRLDVNSLTKTTLSDALKKILHDESYQERVERLSAVVNDQQTTPMERAVWWTEYVLRHKGAKHLRTAAVDMPWYSYLLLDVVLFLLTVALLAVLLLAVAIKLLVNRISSYLTCKQKIN